MDEARFGQKGRVCHRWFIRGQRPPGLCDQRYTWAHLFAAVRPATGQSFALVLPELSTEAMQLFLDMLAAKLAPDEHAALVADQAGWHIAEALCLPDNVTLIYLPPYSPELNPVERLWLYLRERHLSHRLLNGYDAIVDALCHACKQLLASAPAHCMECHRRSDECPPDSSAVVPQLSEPRHSWRSPLAVLRMTTTFGAHPASRAA